MSRILLGFFAAMIVLPGIEAFPGPPPVPQFTEAQVALCKTEGGCVLVTRDFLRQMADHIAKLRSKLDKSCA